MLSERTTSAIKVVAFMIVWLTLFFEILFDPTIREFLFYILSARPWLAPALLVIVQVSFASLALPCSPLTALAGVLWGMEMGMLYSIVATFLASMWTFVFARHVSRRRSGERTRYAAILRLIEQHGWKASMIAHANPVFPGSSLGYAFGITNVSMKSYAVGAVLGTLPLQILLVGVGHWGRIILTDRFSVWIGLLMLTAVVTLIAYKWLVPRCVNRLSEKSQKKDETR